MVNFKTIHLWKSRNISMRKKVFELVFYNIMDSFKWIYFFGNIYPFWLPESSIWKKYKLLNELEEKYLEFYHQMKYTPHIKECIGAKNTKVA